ncbi:hypothetical protein AKO1_015777 [Acrasis kona]|uniref:Cytochrome b-c1 complex subunit 8 n=1 Tax=Acrasis kona TaxID=1008807 RepID=A0AAW2ZIB3_9EUKA
MAGRLVGRVQRTISPFQQQIFKGYIEGMPLRLWDRFVHLVSPLILPVLVFGSLYKWTDNKHKENTLNHRS